MKIKLFILKHNKEVKKTPIYYDSIIDIAKSPPDSFRSKSLLIEDEHQNIYIEYNGEVIKGKDLYNLIKAEVDKHNQKRQDLLSQLYNKRKQELNEKVSKLTEKQQELFWLLYDGLSCFITFDFIENTNGHLFFHGIPLEKVKVYKKELPKLLEW